MSNKKQTYYTAVEERFLGSKVKIHSREFYSHPCGKWFYTEEEAMANFLGVREKAKLKAEEIINEYEALTKKLGFDIGFNMDGDTHGIYDDYLYIRFELDGYYFLVEID